jgi:cellobiose phosphorylase
VTGRFDSIRSAHAHYQQAGVGWGDRDAGVDAIVEGVVG